MRALGLNCVLQAPVEVHIMHIDSISVECSLQITGPHKFGPDASHSDSGADNFVRTPWNPSKFAANSEAWMLEPNYAKAEAAQPLAAAEPNPVSAH